MKLFHRDAQRGIRIDQSPVPSIGKTQDPIFLAGHQQHDLFRHVPLPALAALQLVQGALEGIRLDPAPDRRPGIDAAIEQHGHAESILQLLRRSLRRDVFQRCLLANFREGRGNFSIERRRTRPGGLAG